MQVLNHQQFSGARGGGRGGLAGKNTSSNTPAIPSSSSAGEAAKLISRPSPVKDKGEASRKRTHSDKVARAQKPFSERHPRISKAFSFLINK